MSIRTICEARIPALTLVTDVTDQQLAENMNRGAWHRFIVMWDVAWGVWGGPEPVTTISSRCARTLLNSQVTSSIGTTLQANTPLWALALGAFLEMIDPGHLQGAMIADVSRQIGGLKYLTGVRVLLPKEAA